LDASVCIESPSEEFRVRGYINGLLAVAVSTIGLPAFAAGGGSDSLAPTAQTDVRTAADLPPLPAGQATVLGGTISTVDHLRDRLVLQVFGGGRTVITFDIRTRVYRDGKAASLDDLKNGERVYADTVLDGTHIFARNINLGSGSLNGETNGQIVSFEPGTGELTLRDTLSLIPWRMRLTSETVIVRGDHPAAAAELQPGGLVAVSFLPARDGRIAVQRIAILASPGMTFLFSGRLEHFDLRRGLLTVVDPRDQKSYQVSFDPSVRGLTRDVREGMDVTVSASFDGQRYTAHSIALNAAPTQ
jgi:hypothetical protein